MRIVEHREPVRLQADHFVDSAGEVVRGLLRQAVDQINVDRAKLQCARSVDHRAGFFQALQAIDRTLHRRVEVLQADADAVETQFTQQAHGRPVGFTRVDLDAVIARVVLQQVKVLAQVCHQLAQFVVAEKVGVPPPKCSCSTVCAGSRWQATSWISCSSRCRYGCARPRSLVMTLLQAQ